MLPHTHTDTHTENKRQNEQTDWQNLQKKIELQMDIKIRKTHTEENTYRDCSIMIYRNK